MYVLEMRHELDGSLVRSIWDVESVTPRHQLVKCECFGSGKVAYLVGIYVDILVLAVEYNVLCPRTAQAPKCRAVIRPRFINRVEPA